MAQKHEEEKSVYRLTEDDREAIKNQILDEIYTEIGKGVVKRLLWLLGLGAAALLGYLTSKGYIR